MLKILIKMNINNIKLIDFIKTVRGAILTYSYTNLGHIKPILLSVFYDSIDRMGMSELQDSEITFDIQGLNLINNKEVKKFTFYFSITFDKELTFHQIEENIDFISFLEELEENLVIFNKIRIIIEKPLTK
jgi:hypothetical protein